MLGVRQARRPLRRRIATLGLTGHVDVLPPVPPPAMAGYYQAADVLAFASTTDTQSLVLTEAEAAGLPVVLADRRLATRPGTPSGPPRYATDPEPDAFAAALLRMLEDTALRASVARAGLAATAAYPPELFLTRLVDLYRRAT
jgi:glycosyltransferase involved in cell wall biosynthesis